MVLIKHIIIGDVHGYFDNLRSFLLEVGAINESNNRINRDQLKVYSAGDLIDGDINRDGDLLLLEYAEEWFDKIAIGNHEYAFMGGPNFGARIKDRELTRQLLQLEQRKVYVPAFTVNDWLITHAGLADRWGFNTPKDALYVINRMWDWTLSEREDNAMFDWVSHARGGKWGNDTGGIFWLDWFDERNQKINQIMGHSTIPSGPTCANYRQSTHWNIDVGGKYGCCLGGVTIEGREVTPLFWGSRVLLKKTEPVEEDPDDMNELMFKELMEGV